MGLLLAHWHCILPLAIIGVLLIAGSKSGKKSENKYSNDIEE